MVCAITAGLAVQIKGAATVYKDSALHSTPIDTPLANEAGISPGTESCLMSNSEDVGSLVSKAKLIQFERQHVRRRVVRGRADPRQAAFCSL